jgi:type IV secretory pathway protease TraF
LPDKFWQFDQARNFDNNNMKQCISSKYINETSAQISEDYCRGSEDFTIIVPERPHDMSTMSSAMGNRLSITSYTQDEPCQDLAKCFDPSETKKCNGAYENEAIEQNSENENTPRTVPMTFQFEDGELSSDEDSVPQGEQYYRNQSTLPKIEIICNSSASQMSGSNNEDETNDRKSSRKTKKKLKRSHFAVEKAISSPALIGQGFSGKNLPGRMGRRGSVFVVGFLGKRWQAKAAKSRKNRSKSKRTSGELSPNKSHLELLQVSPTISSRGSSPNDESCRTSITSFNTPNTSVSSTSMVFRFPGNQASPEPSSFRRSSCPTLPTLNISEDKMDLNLATNGCTGHNEDENSAKYCDTNDIVLGSGSLDGTRSNDTIPSEDRLDTNQPELDTKDSDVHTKHNRVDTNHCEVNTKHNEFETKGNKFQTKHDVDFKRNRVDTNHHEADAKKLEGEKGSPEMDEEVGNICKEKAKVDINCSELNRELSNEGTRIDSKGNKSDMMLKQEKLVSNQRSFLSNESDSSLRAEYDGTVPRSSSPLMRQKAFMSCKEREDKSLDNNDEMQGPSLQNCFTIDHAGKTFDYHGKSGKSSKSETDGLDSVPKTKRSIITLVEIGKNQASNSQFSSPDSLKTLTIENTKQGGTKNIPSSIIQKTSDDKYNLTKGSSDNKSLSPNKSHLELLQVSPTISSRGSSPNDESCRTSITSFNTPNTSVSSTSMVFRFPGNQASPEPSSFRRSSCPTLPTLNISEDKMDLNLATNGCTGHNEDENSAKYCDTNDIVLGSGSLDGTRSNDTIPSEDRLDTNQPELDTKDSDVHTKHNRVDTNHCEVNTKHNEFETKGNKFQTKHDVDFKRNRVDTNHHEADAKKLEGEKGSPEMDEEVGNICKEKAKVDINCSELNRELSNEGTRIDSKGNKSDMMLKQEKLVSNQRSFLSNESDSSLRAEYDGTVPRSSSPLMRQKAFMSCKEREDKSLDNNDEMQGPSLQNCFTIDHAGKTFDYHGKSGKSSKSETDGLDSVPKTKCSIITLVEIGKNQPSNSQFSSPDSLKTLTIENTKQGGTKNIPSSIIQKTSDDEYNLTKGSSDNNGNLTDTETTFKSKQGVQMKKIISETIQDKPKIKSVADNQAIITNEDRGKDLTGRTIKLVNKTGKPSNPNFTNKEIESTQNFQATEYASENENTGGRNNEVYVKSLMRENGGFKKSNFIPSTANQQKQGLINGHSDGNETKDGTQDRMNGISPRDQGSINDLHFDDKCHIDKTNKKIGCINNYAQNDGKNKPTDQPIQNNNRDSTDVRKYETVDTPEHKNPTISPVNVKKNLTNNLYKTNQSTTKNENFRENTVASKFYSRNLAYKGGQYHSLTSSMSSQGSADQSKSFEYTINSGTLRKVEAQDSGIYCSDYRSSIDSVSSLTERNSDREMLKTISEVEHDYDYRDGMLYFQPLSGQYYEKSRSYVLEIRDETPV